MLTCHALRCINIFVQELKITKKLFGGKVLVLGCCSSWMQIFNIIGVSIKNFPLWSLFKVFKLSKNISSREQDDVNKWLLEIRDGRLTNDYNMEEDNMEIHLNVLEENDVIKTLYRSSIDADDIKRLSEKIIFTKNEDALS